MTKDIHILDEPLKIISGEAKGFVKANFFVDAINPIITTINAVAKQTETSLSGINQTIGESTTKINEQISSLQSILDSVTEESDLNNPNAVPSPTDHNDAINTI